MRALRLFLWMVALTGGLYPLLLTVIAQSAFYKRANGSLIIENEKIIGSELIGQLFYSENYFWPRPSTVNYNPMPSSGSNLGPTSRRLKADVENRRKRLASAHNSQDIPSDLLFASGSGLDPHISLQAAYFQTDRVAEARGMEKKDLEDLIKKIHKKRVFGFLGTPCINVLKLNLALDDNDKRRRAARS